MTAPRYLNFRGYSDVEPYEVVKVISPITVEIRPMKATLAPDWRPEMVPGGFSVVTVNNYDQRWVIESDPTAPTTRARLGKKGWKSRYGFHSADDVPRKFYDYNF